MGTPTGYSLWRALERDVCSVVSSRTWKRLMYLGLMLSVVYFLVFASTPTQRYRICKSIIQHGSGQQAAEPHLCAPREHVFHLRVHKSGGGDLLHNILMRKGYLQQHNFVLPKDGLYLGHPGKFGMDLVDERFFANEEHFDVFTHHSRFSPEGVDEVMPEDTLRVTVLREPVALFASIYNDYHLSNVSDQYKGSLAQFLDSLDLEVLKKRNPQFIRMTNKIGINQMAFDAGLETSSFRNQAAVYKLILQMEEHFDLVLIAEQMEQSLVLLADALCWPMDDVVSLTKGVDRASNATSVVLTEEQRQKARALNDADVAIYEHFVKTFQLRMRRFGERRMADGLKRLRTRTKLMAERCAAKDDVPQVCSLMAMSEHDLTNLIRQKQLQRFAKYAKANNKSTIKNSS